MTPEVKKNSVPLVWWVILGKSLHFYVPQFLNLGNGDVVYSYLLKNIWEHVWIWGHEAWALSTSTSENPHPSSSSMTLNPDLALLSLIFQASGHLHIPVLPPSKPSPSPFLCLDDPLRSSFTVTSSISLPSSHFTPDRNSFLLCDMCMCGCVYLTALEIKVQNAFDKIVELFS